jgi:hypothetical protein
LLYFSLWPVKPSLCCTAAAAILFAGRPFLLGATGAEAFATEHGPAGRRLEGDGVGFPALVAGDLITLALTAASAAPAAAAKIGTARITTSFASFRLAQIPFLVILLLAFRKGESVSAFRAGDVNVRHDRFLHEKARRGRLRSLLPTEAPGASVFQRLAVLDNVWAQIESAAAARQRF